MSYHPQSGGFEEILRRIINFYEHYDGHDVFVFSVSEARDDLSQWRAYGGGGPSFSIGFDPRELEIAADPAGFVLEKVIYDPVESKQHIAGLLDPSILAIAKDIMARGGLTMPAEDFARKWGPDIIANLARIAPVYKHPSFGAEREWRLIARQGMIRGNADLPLCFRRSGSLVVPYVEARFMKRQIPRPGFASVRNIAADDADRQNMLFDTRRSRISRTRVFPLPGSGEINARRGVVWKCRTM